MCNISACLKHILLCEHFVKTKNKRKNEVFEL